MIAGAPLTIEDALAVVEHWGASNHTRPDPTSGRGQLLAAAELLAGYVVDHRPVMPQAVRGRTVDHAVRPVRAGDQYGIASLCGGLAPDWTDTPPVLDVAGRLDGLALFDPTADDACKTCTRRLPVELRPRAPGGERVRAVRQVDHLAGVELRAVPIADSRPGGRADRVAVLDVADRGTGDVILSYDDPPTVRQVNKAVVEHYRSKDLSTQHD